MISIAGAVDVADLDPRHPDAGVAAHYGDPMREQRLLATEVGLVDRSHRVVCAVAGGDRLGWLHSLTSQHLERLPAMTATETLLLSPHGQVEEHLGVLDDGSTTWLDGEPGRADPIMRFLRSMVFRMLVEPAEHSARLAILSLVGPATAEVLSHLGVPDLPEPDIAPVPRPRAPAASAGPRASSLYAAAALSAFDGLVRKVPGGADLILPRGAMGDLVVAAGAPLAGIWAYEALRVQERRPRLGFETDHKTLPSEVGWSTALHLNKGCYRGQEGVAKVHLRGRPPRRMVMLHLDGLSDQTLPGRHAPVLDAQGAAVGLVGTSARHYELGPVALALVRNVADLGPVLTVDGVAAAIDPD